MADLAWHDPVEAPALRRALRLALRTAEPSWRVVAEGFLAEASPVDLLAVGEAGELIAIRIADPSFRDGGARLLARGLSDLGWFGPRVGDLQALAPGLGLSLVSPPRSVLFAPTFDAELRSACEALALEAGLDRVSCRPYQALRHQGQLTLLLDDPRRRPPLRPAPSSPDLGPADTDRDRPDRPRLTDPPSPSAFRTGLTDADLALPLAGAPTGPR